MLKYLLGEERCCQFSSVSARVVAWMTLFVAGCGSRTEVLQGEASGVGASMDASGNASTAPGVGGSSGNRAPLENQFPCYPAGVEIPGLSLMHEPIVNPAGSRNGYEVCVAAPSASLIEHRPRRMHQRPALHRATVRVLRRIRGIQPIRRIHAQRHCQSMSLRMPP